MDPGLEEKIDRTNEHLTEVRLCLARVEENVKYHIKRTDLLEKHVEGHVDDMEERMNIVEGINRRFQYWVLGIMGSGLLTAVGILVKLVLLG